MPDKPACPSCNGAGTIQAPECGEDFCERCGCCVDCQGECCDDGCWAACYCCDYHGKDDMTHSIDDFDGKCRHCGYEPKEPTDA